MASDFISALGVSFGFATSKPQILVRLGEEAGCKISYELCSDAWDDSIKLSSGEDLMKIRGYLHLTGIPEAGVARERLGTIHFLPASDGSTDGVIRPSPDAFSIECGISQSELDRLISAERLGKGITSARFTVKERMTFGWAPDGSQILWDVSENNWTPVSAMSLIFSNQADRAMPELDDGLSEEDDGSSDKRSFEGINASLGALRDTIESRSSWIIGLLVLIAAVMISRGYS